LVEAILVGDAPAGTKVSAAPSAAPSTRVGSDMEVECCRSCSSWPARVSPRVPPPGAMTPMLSWPFEASSGAVLKTGTERPSVRVTLTGPPTGEQVSLLLAVQGRTER